MRFTVTTLVENSVGPSIGYVGEHGLAFLIESEAGKILYDTGQGFALFRNAELLRLDLKSIDTIILSHGHFDHAGGLKPLLNSNSHFTFVAHPEVFANKQVYRFERYNPIGVSASMKEMEQAGVKNAFKYFPY
jgi:7,8-dihydropterin-6-yl-methyl-4-(beta-D-ribofuranosyl)aminobenzene 5'-phosphate synthase